VADGWSMGVLLRELAALYEAYAAGRPPSLPELPIQYADFAAWQRQWLTGSVYEEQLSWWRRALEGAPRILQIRTGRPRPAAPTFRGASEPVVLDAALTSSLRELAGSEGATLFMVLAAGLGAALSRMTRQNDLLIGTPIANRNRSEIEGLIGFFVNTLPL